MILDPENGDRTCIRNLFLRRTTRPHGSDDRKIQVACSRPARTAVTTKADCPCSLPTFRGIPLFRDTMSHHCVRETHTASILRGSDDLQTFEDDGNTFIRIFGQRLPS
jgi:hypothetical protein